MKNHSNPQSGRIAALMAITLAFTFAFTFALSGNPPEAEPKVYAAGLVVNDSGINEARLWVNGFPQKLELKHGGNGPSEARGVVVTPGGDVWVVGHESLRPGKSQSVYSALYWKNGARFALEPEEATYHGLLHGIAVYGNDVYIWGNTERLSQSPTQSKKAVFWKIGPDGNKVCVELTKGLSGTASYCLGVGVVGNDVYAAFYGTASAAGDATGVNTPKLWKAPGGDFDNPVITDLPLPSNTDGAATVSALWVSDGSVYVTGNAWATSIRPLLWKDGALQSFTNDRANDANIYSGAGYNGKIYMAGTQTFVKVPKIRAQLWTDGRPKTLSDTSANPFGATTARCVFANDSGVYVGGYNNLENRNPVIWINGTAFRHEAGGKSASIEGVFVK